jgi:hypothetical protein
MGNGGPRKKKLCGAVWGTEMNGDTRRQLLREWNCGAHCLFWSESVECSGDGLGWRSGGDGEEYPASYDDEVFARTVF